VVSTRRPAAEVGKAPGYRWLQELWRGFFVQLHSAFTQGRAYLQVFCAALTSSVDRPSRRRRACRGFAQGMVSGSGDMNSMWRYREFCVIACDKVPAIADGTY